VSHVPEEIGSRGGVLFVFFGGETALLALFVFLGVDRADRREKNDAKSLKSDQSRQ
jgi:hypothetical protein